MKTPVRSNWTFPVFSEWVKDQKNWFDPHSSRVNYPDDRKVIQDVVPDYEKPKTRPPFDISN